MYKNYNMNQVTLSLDLEKNDIVFIINELAESITEESFENFQHNMGILSYHPRMMIKLILCGYT